jgi:hypothetical protein
MTRLLESIAEFFRQRLRGMMLSGPFLALFGIYGAAFSFQQLMVQREQAAHGVKTAAVIAKADLQTTKTGTRYYVVDLAWRDAQDKEYGFKDIKLSYPYSANLLRYPSIQGGTLDIKYLPDRPDTPPLLLDDPEHPERDFSYILFFDAMTVFGLGATLYLYAPRRRQDASG